MRLFELENQDIKDSDIEEFEKFFDNIEEDCRLICHLYREQQKVFYRGMKLIPDLFHGMPKENRKPLHTDEVVHNFLTKAFTNSGFTVNRSNCSFMVSKESRAGTYGDSYVCFPKDGTEYVWSPNIRDLYVYVRDNQEYDELKKDGKTTDFKKNPLMNDYQEYLDTLVKNHYQSNGLNTAIQTDNEVMYRGEYYLIHYSKFKYFIEQRLGFHL